MLRLEQLVLAGNGIGMQGGQAVAAALPKLTQLQVWGFATASFKGSLKLKVTYPKDPGVSKSKGVNPIQSYCGDGIGTLNPIQYGGVWMLRGVSGLFDSETQSMIYLPAFG